MQRKKVSPETQRASPSVSSYILSKVLCFLLMKCNINVSALPV